MVSSSCYEVFSCGSFPCSRTINLFASLGVAIILIYTIIKTTFVSCKLNSDFPVVEQSVVIVGEILVSLDDCALDTRCEAPSRREDDLPLRGCAVFFLVIFICLIAYQMAVVCTPKCSARSLSLASGFS